MYGRRSDDRTTENNREGVVRRLLNVVLLVSASALVHSVGVAQAPAWPEKLPVYDHIVIVIEENKNSEQVIGSTSAPYMNGVLRKEGANLTHMYAEEHNSEGNYFWLFSGSNQQVGFDDVIPNGSNNKAYPFTSPNLGAQLIARGAACG